MNAKFGSSLRGTKQSHIGYAVADQYGCVPRNDEPKKEVL
jgi:hypothetical protein